MKICLTLKISLKKLPYKGLNSLIVKASDIIASSIF